MLKLVEAPPELVHGVRDLLCAVAESEALPLAHRSCAAFRQRVQELGGPASVGQADPERGSSHVQGRVGRPRVVREGSQAQTRVA